MPNLSEESVNKRSLTLSGFTQTSSRWRNDLEGWNIFVNESKKRFFEKREKMSTSYAIRDFKLIKTLCQGSFSLVLLAQQKDSEEYVAIKAFNKRTLIDLKLVQYTANEKRILLNNESIFLSNMRFYFQDSSYIYFVLPFIQGGDLFTLMRYKKKMSESQAKFYLAQVILALDYLHALGVVHRDLKAENIMICLSGYVQIGDFGVSKFLKGRTYSMVGTPSYMAPEMLLNKGHGLAVDWWAMGVLSTELVTGSTPFPNDGDVTKAVSGNFNIPPNHSHTFKSFVTSLLQPDPSRRLGNLKNGTEDVIRHEWMENVPWKMMISQQVKPPFVPKVTGSTDTRYFATSEKHTLTLVNINQSEEVHFSDF